MSAQEEWRPVVGCPGYEVSSYGRVLSRQKNKPRIMKPATSNKGYLQLGLRASGQRVYRSVHSLVAEAFHGPRPDGMDVCHQNGDQQDNRAENLAYKTRQENILDQVRHGTHRWAKRTHCLYGHPYDEANTRTTGRGRECRACGREKSRLNLLRRNTSPDYVPAWLVPAEVLERMWHQQ